MKTSLLICGSMFAALLPRAAEEMALSEGAPSSRYPTETAGLYGDTQNRPPLPLQVRALEAARQIVRRNEQGETDPKGVIGFLALGMSNTALHFKAFEEACGDDLAPDGIRLINGAIGGKDAADWAGNTADPDSPWQQVTRRLEQAGVSTGQVQVIWMMHAHRRPDQYGEYPAHVKKLTNDLQGILSEAEKRFPNLQLIYLSSRMNARFAKTPLNPEPYAYESAFAVRDLILDAMNTPNRFRAPLLWGPYLWAPSEQARKDGLRWELQDFQTKDGTHPSPQGVQKSAARMKSFFSTDEAARVWWVSRKNN